LEYLSGQDYVESHVPLLNFFINKLKPDFTIELGCGYATTSHLDQVSVSHLAYESRLHYMEEVESSLTLKSTEFISYPRIERVLQDLEIFKSTYDLAVVGGPLQDRVSFCQKILDVGCKCILLLDYDNESTIGYRKLRYSNSVYDFRVFTNASTKVETGVFLRNYLNSVSLKEYQ
jgi:hypothetical protein